MTDTTDDAVTLETAMIRFGIRNDLNCTGEPRMTTERQHTLVGCATCGTGDQPKYMVSVGADWLCTRCAGASLQSAWKALYRSYSNYDNFLESHAMHVYDDGDIPTIIDWAYERDLAEDGLPPGMRDRSAALGKEQP